MKKFIVWVVSLTLIFSALILPPLTFAASDALVVGDKVYPVYQRGVYYSAWAEVEGSVHVKISAGGVSEEKDITADGKKLLVVYRKVDDEMWQYQILPAGPDKNIPRDTTFIVKRKPAGAIVPGTKVTFYVYTTRREIVTLQMKMVRYDWKAEDAPASPSIKDEQLYTLKKVGQTDDGLLDVWSVEIPFNDVGLYEYHFYGYDGTFKRMFKGDYRVTVYKPDFSVPQWIKGAVVYQIFPDRFRNGDTSNDPTQDKTFTFHDYYLNVDEKEPNDFLGVPKYTVPWDAPVMAWDTVGGQCRYVDTTRYYGGDLKGIIESLDYLKSLGVDVLYINPIFPAPSTHRYDPTSYHAIDPILGDLDTFKTLVAEAKKRGMKIILDVTPDHSSDRSLYFDSQGEFSTMGAHESQDSPYYSWYKFIKWPDKYQGWAGLGWMPTINVLDEDYQKFFLTDDNSVVKFWNNAGAMGWRVDVAMIIPTGFLKEYREAIKAINPDAVLVAEVWNKPKEVIPMLLGDQMDTVMNYRFAAATVVDWDSDHEGTKPSAQGFFLNKDMSSAEFWQRIDAIYNDYPSVVHDALWNLVDSHDMARPLYYFKDKNALKALSALQIMFKGAPTIFYGDEAGATNAGEKGCKDDRPLANDPFMRVPYPWGSEDKDLIAWYSSLNALRHQYDAIKEGGMVHFSANNDRILAFARIGDGKEVFVFINPDGEERANVVADALGYVKDGTYTPSIGSGDMTVENGKISLGTMKPYEVRIYTLDYAPAYNDVSYSVSFADGKIAITPDDMPIVKVTDNTTGQTYTLGTDKTFYPRGGHTYTITVYKQDKGLITGKYQVTLQGEGEDAVDPIYTNETGSTSEGPILNMSISDPEGDDYGPGTYTYPTNEVFKPGDFDLLKFEARSEGDTYIFRWQLKNVDNPWNGAWGISKQVLMVFVDNRDGGTDEGLEGMNGMFTNDFKWDEGIKLEGWESKLYTVEGGEIAEADLKEVGATSTVTYGENGWIEVRIPKEAIGEIGKGAKVVAMVLGQDGYGPGRIRQVKAKAEEWAFGGGSDGNEDPNIIDLIVPEGYKQEEVLDWRKQSPVRVPGILVDPYIQMPQKETINMVINDPEGDDYGPGTYTYPLASVFKPGDFDLLQFALTSTTDGYEMKWVLKNIDNCWGSPVGLSKQTLIVFIDNQEGGTDQGLEGLNAMTAGDFKWDYALQIEGWVSKLYKVDGGEIVGEDINDYGITVKAVEGAPGTVYVYVPEEAIGSLGKGSKIITMVVGQDGYGPGRIRQVNAKAEEWRFGGGSDGSEDPNIIDMVVPEGYKQEEVLDWTKQSPVRLPGILLDPYIQTPAQKVLNMSISDPEGDDYGPGTYTYPTNEVFRPGDFDLLKFEARSEGDTYIFRWQLKNVDNPWNGAWGISKQVLMVFVDNRDGGTDEGLEGMNGMFTNDFKWDEGIKLEGWESKLYTVEGGEIAEADLKEVGATSTVTYGENGWIEVRIPKEAIGEIGKGAKVVAMVLGQDGYGPGRIRQVKAKAEEWAFGGGSDGNEDPNIIDLIVPEGYKQEEVLDWRKQSPVRVPGILVDPYIQGGTEEISMTIVKPSDGAVIGSKQIDVVAMVKGTDKAYIYLGGKQIATVGVTDGKVEYQITVPGEGTYEIGVGTKDKILSSVKVTIDLHVSGLEITSPTSKIVSSRKVYIEGITEPESVVTIKQMKGIKEGTTSQVKADKDGHFKSALFRMFHGVNVFRIEVVDPAGNKLIKHYVYVYPSALKIVMKIDDPVAIVGRVKVKLDVPPTIINDRTMVPVRFIAESFSAIVDYDEATQQITIQLGDDTIQMFVGQKTYYVNGKPHDDMDAPPVIKDGRTLVPVRFVAQALGASVGWDGETRTVTVVYPGE